MVSVFCHLSDGSPLGGWGEIYLVFFGEFLEFFKHCKPPYPITPYFAVNLGVVKVDVNILA